MKIVNIIASNPKKLVQRYLWNMKLLKLIFIMMTFLFFIYLIGAAFIIRSERKLNFHGAGAVPAGIFLDKKSLPMIFQPKFYGNDNKDNPFFIEAAEAVQISANQINLQQAKGEFFLSANNLLKIESDDCILWQSDKLAYFKQNVLLKMQSFGYALEAQQLKIDYGNGKAYAQDNLKLTASFGNITADHLMVDKVTNLITFNDNVKVVINNM